MAKQLSDIVRDRIIEARKGKPGAPVILTDSEACDLWTSLGDVEAEIYMLEKIVFKKVEFSFKRVRKALTAAKKEFKKLKKRSKQRKI